MGLQEHLSEYASLDAVVLGIAGQWPREVRQFAEGHQITYPLLIDKDRSVIKRYGVYHWLGIDAYNIARPATFIIDKAGTVRFIYVGSHQFDLAKHEDIVACLRTLG